MRMRLLMLMGVALVGGAMAGGQTIIDYRGLEIQSPDPTGAAGLRLQNNFKALADRIGPANLTATAAPTVDDDVDEGYYAGSLWYDTVGGVLYWCADNTDGAAVWHDLTGTTFSLDLKSGGGLEIDGGGELTLTSTHLTGEIGIAIDGAGTEIADGVKGFVRVPYACTITGVYLMADQDGDIVVDIWKDTFANYPPTVADTITASAKPTLSTADSSSDITLTGWTKSVAAGDVIGFNVDSCDTITRLTLQITVTK